MKSGIADYSAELLPHLAAECEVELIVDEGFRPDAALAARFPVHGHRALPRLLDQGRFDTVLYQLGNNADYHAAIYRTLLEHPGIVVLHEFVLHHLVRELTLEANRPELYVDELRYAYGRTGEAAGRRCLATGACRSICGAIHCSSGWWTRASGSSSTINSPRPRAGEPSPGARRDRAASLEPRRSAG